MDIAKCLPKKERYNKLSQDISEVTIHEVLLTHREMNEFMLLLPMARFLTVTSPSEAVSGMIQPEKPKHLLFDPLQKVSQPHS